MHRPPPPPREFVGLARQLRSEIATEDTAACAAIEKLVRPLHQRAARHPIPRPELLVDAAKQWESALPATARLALNVKITRRELAIDELRLSALDFRLLDWDSDNYEPGVCLIHVRLRVSPHVCELESPILGCASIHAIARRFQRGLDVSRAAIFADLAALATAPVEGDDPEREVRTKHGKWVGMIVSLRAGERITRSVVARTYV
jgi:hypothetical protein